MSSIYMYAELLLNIRQVTVFAILPSICDEGTRIALGFGQKTLHLQHEEHEATIELPCQVVCRSALKVPPTATKELSFRLGVDAAASLPSLAKSDVESFVPWPASQLTSETQLACQSCGNLLVKDATVWKDLPSGSWADMMDFWHCHKPIPEISNGVSTGSTKGYAAANDLGPTAGVGLVDVGHFLIAESDCIGIQTKSDHELLTCSSCDDPVGVQEKRGRTFRLHKWSLAVQRSHGNIWETYSVQEIISAQLLALIEDQATYKFLAYCGNIDDATDALLLWVFTPDMMYSTIAKPKQRAMKVFYKAVTDPPTILEKHSNKIEELQLTEFALKTLQSDLQTSTNILPPSAQEFQTWTIGLLDR